MKYVDPYIPEDPVAEEAELLQGLREGDAQAFEKLVRWHFGRLFAVANRILRSETDAQDAVQEAFVMAYRAMDRFDGRSKLSTWLHRITVNAALMRLRKIKRLHEVSVEDLGPKFSDEGYRRDVGPTWKRTAEEDTLEQERADQVHEAIAQLPESYREIIMLRDIEQLDTEQTAKALGIKPGAVKTRLHRARQALRELLDPYMQEAGV